MCVGHSISLWKEAWPAPACCIAGSTLACRGTHFSSRTSLEYLIISTCTAGVQELVFELFWAVSGKNSIRKMNLGAFCLGYLPAFLSTGVSAAVFSALPFHFILATYLPAAGTCHLPTCLPFPCVGCRLLLLPATCHLLAAACRTGALLLPPLSFDEL